jgi:hypothetical protein
MNESVCPRCQAPNPAAASFCSRCGLPLVSPDDLTKVHSVAPTVATTAAAASSGGIMAKVGGAWRRYDGALKRRWPRGRWAVHGVTALLLLGLVASPAANKSTDPTGAITPSSSPTSAVVAEATSAEATPTATPEATPSGTPEVTAEPTEEPIAEPTEEPTPEPPAEAFKPIKLSGRGDKVAKFKIPEDTPAIVRIKSTGSSNFAVWTIGDDGDKHDLLVNTIGRYSGTRLFDTNGHSVAFEIEASGSWTMTVAPITRSHTWDGAKKKTVKGDDVLWLTETPDEFAVVDIRHKGKSNFAVWSHGTNGSQLMVNEIGNYSGESVLEDGTILFEVEADGTWSMTLE